MADVLKVLLDAIQEAGEAAYHLQKTGLSIGTKANNEIVTEADLLANEILKQQLTEAFPHYGWLSEESVDEPARLQCERVWVVDPIDGTKEFATGIPEYAVSVALVEHGTPIVAAVFNPATNELFHAALGLGAWMGGKKLQAHYQQETAKPIFLASRSEVKRGEWQRFEAIGDIQQVGSIAYKLALIAAGRAHATFSLGPKNEWDIAAGVLIVQEAGGIATNKRQGKLIFNRESSKVDGIVASGSGINQQVFSWINTSQQ